MSIMDKGARESIMNFEKGVGDVAITYENEVLVGRQAGQTYEYVIPRSTILIENPVAVVDAYVDKHGDREVAEASSTSCAPRRPSAASPSTGCGRWNPTVAKRWPRSSGRLRTSGRSISWAAGRRCAIDVSGPTGSQVQQQVRDTTP